MQSKFCINNDKISAYLPPPSENVQLKYYKTWHKQISKFLWHNSVVTCLKTEQQMTCIKHRLMTGCSQMFEGIRTLNPSAAVDTIIPGIFGCQCNSLGYFCPCFKLKEIRG